VLVTAPAALPATGGVTYAPHPKIGSVHCSSGCESHGRVLTGGTLTIKGSGLSAARRVVFLGGSGKSDDVSVSVTPASDSKLAVQVPYSAASGPLTAWSSKTVHSNSSKPVTIVPAPAPPAPPARGRLAPVKGPADPGAPRFETAVSSDKTYVDGSGVRFSYRISGVQPASVKVTVIQLPDGGAVRTWTRHGVSPGSVHSFNWNARDHHKPAPDGRYAFRMTATSPTGATAHSAASGNQRRDAFDVHGFVFPLHAKHHYGDGFGAPRSGHTHQGQDIFASCGTPIIAPRGGTVKANSYQSAAGNYVVIDGADTGYDFFFAHMRERSSLQVGDRVLTGQRLGNVGDTGDAVGCHLHFEMWTPPGWYTGGHPFDPLPFLKAWDRYS
jgi:murein DD-endopeptidase MepM/ murein hydrolase activator NlpD